MKKRAIPLAVLLTVCLGMIAAVAAGGSSSDPLVSLSYLTGTFQSAIDSKTDAKLDASDAAITSAVTGTNGTSSSTATQLRLKSGDSAVCTEGTGFCVLAGSVSTSFSAGALVDITSGSELASGKTLTAMHQYLVAENTSATFTVSGSSAVVEYSGTPAFSYSTSPDVNAMSAALKSLTLFHGNGVSYGSGYSLESAPTRTEAIVMLIRLLGEEDEALASTAAQPFSDVAGWADRYVAYAYSKGYTNGMSHTKFGGSATASAAMYTEFVMRALGYSDTNHKDISTTLSNALSSGVINSAEYNRLNTGSFLRSEVVYLSYYALTTELKNGSGTLESSLISDGVFTSAEAKAAHTMVSTSRLL